MMLNFFKRRWQVCIVAAVVCFMSYGHAWAESPYPRQRVENHLRSMFLEIKFDFIEKNVPGLKQPGFDFLVLKESIRFYFIDLKKDERGPTEKILIELFVDTLKLPAFGVDAINEDFDLLVYVSDNLSVDGLHPTYRAWLKGGWHSEESYIKRLQKDDPDDTQYLKVGYIRSPGDHIVVMAMEREAPTKMDRYSFEEQMRFTLFSALTGAGWSNVIQPSVVNRSSAEQKHDGFAPIDRAVLRAIFGHDDWSGKDYETRIQLLTDRVMQQLETSQTDGT